MKFIFSLTTVLFVCVSAKKEVVDTDTQGAVDALSQKLWSEIRKRLTNYGYDSDDLERIDDKMSEELCSHNVTDGRIIRTNDSLIAGATFINAPEIQTREECSEECCGVANCNVAVFKDVSDDSDPEDAGTSCYLFDCGTPNICKFTSHPGYQVVTFTSKITTNKWLDKHVDDLENLAEPETTTTKTTSTSTTTKPTVKRPVALYGKCHEHKDCAGSWSECMANYCMCQDGYHAQEGVCRKDCSKFEFECSNAGKPLAFPQCIAIYNRCDKMKLCDDGSDEEDCDEEPQEKHSSDEQTEDSNSSPVDETEDNNEVSEPVDEEDNSDATEEIEVTEEEEEENTSDQASDTQDASSITDEKTPSEEEPKSTGESADQDSKPNEQPDSENSQKTESEESDTSTSNKSQEEVSQINIPEQTGDSVKVVEQIKEEVLLESSSENGMIAKFYRSNKGAVVALSLGLAITALLLVFVGCRLRNVKKRLRRGRPLNSNEADYLINGMYL